MSEGDSGGSDGSGAEDATESTDTFLQAIARVSVVQAPPVARVPDPVRIAHFTVEGRLGKGGMGVVYRATDESLHRTVALKLLPPGFEAEEDRRARFLREARAAAALNHPNIAQVYEVGESDGRIYIAMEYVSGRTLRVAIEGGTLSLSTALSSATQIAAALAHAHAAGVIHRDLKPDNVMLGDDGRVKLLDFGLAKQRASSAALAEIETATAGGHVLGTPAYMSPEQARGSRVTAATDIFAFGVMFHEMLTGMRPFQGDSIGELLRAMERDPPAPASTSNVAVPRSFDVALARCLEKDPAKRVADGAELVALLSALEASREAAPRRSTRRVRVAAAIAPLAIAFFAWAAIARRTPATATAAAPSFSAPAASSSGSVRLMTDVDPGTITNSEALAAFRAALQSMRDGTWTEAEPQLEKAVKAEPAFGAAWLRLSVIRRQEGRSIPDDSFLQAMRFRATMTERDRALLDALAPWLDGTADWGSSVASLLRLRRRFPRDVELLDLALLGIPSAQSPEERVALAREGLALDPEALDFYQMEANALATLGRVDEAIETLDRGVAIAPNATDLLSTRAAFNSGAGRCPEAERDARTSLARGGAAEAAGILAGAMFANGAPRVAVERILAQAVSQSWNRDLRGRLDVATGELAAAEPRLREALAAAGNEGPDQSITTLLLVQLLLEIGRVADAAAAAKTYRNSSATFHGDLSPDLDATLFLASVEVRAGTLPRGAFVSMRDRWLAKERAAFGGASSTEIWIAAYAMPVATPDEAAEARTAGGEYPSLSPGAHGGSHVSAAMGTVRFLAGDHDGALPYLRAVAASCDALVDPVTWLRAQHDLGVVLEAKGDRVGACAAHKVVVDRWGDAKPPTLTGTDSRKRWSALGCR